MNFYSSEYFQNIYFTNDKNLYFTNIYLKNFFTMSENAADNVDNLNPGQSS